MTGLLKYFTSILLCIWAIQGFSQGKYSPTAIRIGYDLSSVVNTLVDPDKTQFEINADIDFHRYYLSLDYGIQKSVREGDDFSYKNSGNFFRIGADVNFNHNDKENSTLFLGLRYARSTFDDEMDYLIEDEIFGPVRGFSSNEKVNAQWIEIVAGLKVKVLKQLFIGYTVRFKFIKSQDLTEELAPFEIPGYGKVKDESTFGFNYSVYYRFKLKKEEILSQEE